MKNFVYLIFPAIFLAACKNHQSALPQPADEIKQHLLSLEHKWLEYEFALDTASISPMLDSTFTSISVAGNSDKQMELTGVYKNISNMRNDSIFIDSFKIEEPVVKLYDNTAIIIFICHTYKRDKSRPVEKRTKFYDVWVRRNAGWKAVSAQATLVEEIK